MVSLLLHSKLYSGILGQNKVFRGAILLPGCKQGESSLRVPLVYVGNHVFPWIPLPDMKHTPGASAKGDGILGLVGVRLVNKGINGGRTRRHRGFLRAQVGAAKSNILFQDTDQVSARVF